METAKRGPTVGQSTGNLLFALRALATAQQQYFLAYQHREPLPGEHLEQAADAFGAVRAIIENDITEAVSEWANRSGETEV